MLSKCFGKKLKFQQQKFYIDIRINILLYSNKQLEFANKQYNTTHKYKAKL